MPFMRTSVTTTSAGSSVNRSSGEIPAGGDSRLEPRRLQVVGDRLGHVDDVVDDEGTQLRAWISRGRARPARSPSSRWSPAGHARRRDLAAMVSHDAGGDGEPEPGPSAASLVVKKGWNTAFMFSGAMPEP